MEKRIIKSSELDPGFKDEVASHHGGENIQACFSCATCAAGCPINEIDPNFSPIKIARKVLLGMRKEVLSDPIIWLCATCHSCYEECPQDVRFFEVLNVLKNIAAREGHSPMPWIKHTRSVRDIGRVFPIDEEVSKKREDAGLPPLKNENRYSKGVIENTGLGEIERGYK